MIQSNLKVSCFSYPIPLFLVLYITVNSGNKITRFTENRSSNQVLQQHLSSPFTEAGYSLSYAFLDVLVLRVPWQIRIGILGWGDGFWFHGRYRGPACSRKAVPAGPARKREQSGWLWFASQKNFGDENGSWSQCRVVSATTFAFQGNAIYI